MPAVAAGRGEVLEQQHAQPEAVLRLGDEERDLGPAVVDRSAVPIATRSSPTVADQGEQRPCVAGEHVSHVVAAGTPAGGEEPHPDAGVGRLLVQLATAARSLVRSGRITATEPSVRSTSAGGGASPDGVGTGSSSSRSSLTSYLLFSGGREPCRPESFGP